MKKTRLVSLLAALSMAVTACSAAASSTKIVSASASTPAPIGAASDGYAVMNLDAGPLSDETQLIAGLFKHEGTDRAVTSQQAATLISLCQSVKATQPGRMEQ